MTWRDRFGSFAKRTTFHGFQEAHESSNWWEKCLWITIMGTCTGMLVWFIHIQTSHYLDGPTATRITPLGGPPAFPPVWVCHLNWTWIDAEKLNRFGITREEWHVAMSYMHRGLVYNSSIPMETAKKSLWEKMRQNNISQILQFFSHVTLDAFDGSDSEGLVTEIVKTPYVTCYLVNGSTLSRTALNNVWRIYFKFNFATFWANAKRLLPFLPKGSLPDPSVLRPVLFNDDTVMFVSLEPEFYTMISTESTIYRPLGRCTRDHPIHEWYSVKSCKLDCEYRANVSVNATTCVDYSLANNPEYTLSFLNDRIPLCHFGMINVNTGKFEGKEDPVFRNLTSHEREQRDKELSTCQEECLPRCDQWRTTWSVTNLKHELPHLAPAGTTVSVVFPDSSSLFVIEEIRQYEWHDLVSDFGGLLGLWLGASMMSLFQLIHLCCSSKDKMKKQTDADPIASRKVEDLWLEIEKLKRAQSRSTVDVPRSRRWKRSIPHHASF